MSNEAASISSASSSSEDDDEDFLTQREDGGSKRGDREALVKRKLLENFYGRSAVAAVAPSASMDTDDDDEDDNEGEAPRTDDLDSPAFDAEAHTKHNVTQANLHELLQTEETLSLSVRTLESNMQTLVYENYSRFIDATDAIKSIGVNVQANEVGLASLTDRMASIHASSQSTETALGGLRDQVAEKIRVKRLLSRLDTLLKLPQTLRQLIATGKYRTAAKNYLSARNILRQHSEGFESLRSIETECTGILQELYQSLLLKLGLWSGRSSLTSNYSSSTGTTQFPANVAEIFECAGALYILQEQQEADASGTEGSDGEEKDDTTLGVDDLQSMAMDATSRIFDRMLDVHLIAVQERRFVNAGLDLDISSVGGTGGLGSTASKGSALVPNECLEAILEVATLYSMSFEQQAKMQYLEDFVQDAFATVLSHVRGVLLDESAHAAAVQAEEETGTGSAHNENDDSVLDGHDAVDEEISGALTILVQSVREVASALALPEVGLDASMAADFVDKALQLTETLVRRRVEQKFQDLRVNIIQECLNPFVEQVSMVLQKKDTPIDIPEIVQMAGSTLSNCLQLVDDTIRSILVSNAAEDGPNEMSPDFPILRDSVQHCILGFVEWLANALEFLAGGELCDAKYLVLCVTDPEGTGAGKSLSDQCWDDSLRDMIVASRHGLLRGSLSSEDADGVPTDFILAIAEMCRLAEASVAENLDQSISTHAGGKKKSKAMFQAGEAGQRHERTSQRFQQAAARALVLFTTRVGLEVADCICDGLDSLEEESVHVKAPRKETCVALEIVKTTAIKCADLFGGPKRGGPVDEVDQSAMPSLSSQLQRKTGLQLDVERLFKEKVSILPETLEEVEFSASYASFNILKIAGRSLLEYCRYQSFSMEGFSQLQLDIELMKHLVEHYIKKDLSPNGTDACLALRNVLSDALLSAGERCIEEGYSEDVEILRETKQRLHSFLTSSETTAERDSFLIDSE